MRNIRRLLALALLWAVLSPVSWATSNGPEQCVALESTAYRLLEDPPSDKAPILELVGRAINACEQASKRSRSGAESADFLRRASLLRGALFAEQPGDHRMEARRSFEEAVDQIAGLCGARCEAIIEPMEKLGSWYLREQRYADGKRMLEEALAIREEVYGPDDFRAAQGHLLLGTYYSTQFAGPDEIEAMGKDQSKADEHYQRAADLVLTDADAPTDEVIRVLRTYSGHLLASDRQDAALEILAKIGELESAE